MSICKPKFLKNYSPVSHEEMRGFIKSHYNYDLKESYLIDNSSEFNVIKLKR